MRGGPFRGKRKAGLVTQESAGEKAVLGCSTFEETEDSEGVTCREPRLPNEPSLLTVRTRSPLFAPVTKYTVSADMALGVDASKKLEAVKTESLALW